MGDQNWQGGPVLAAKIGPGVLFLVADRFFCYRPLEDFTNCRSVPKIVVYNIRQCINFTYLAVANKLQ